MDTTENTDKLQKLQMLKQDKQDFEKKLSMVDVWVYPLRLLICLAFVFSITTMSFICICGVILIISLPFVVKHVKLRWAMDDIEREIKRIEKISVCDRTAT